MNIRNPQALFIGGQQVALHELSAKLNGLITAGMDHQRNRRYVQAESCLRQIAAILPSWADVHNNLGCALEGQGRQKEAAESYARAVTLDPTHAVAHHNLGCILAALGNVTKATEHFEQAVVLKPDYAEAYCNLGNALLACGKLNQAISNYGRALSIDPNFASAHNNMGNALKAQSKLDDAIASYRRSISLKPDDASTYNNLACVFLDQNKLDDAVVFYEKALSLDPNYAEALCNLGVALKNQGRHDQAKRCLTQAVKLKPDYPDAYNNLASVLKDQGLLDAAERYCDRALAINSDFAGAHCNLGTILLDRGELEQAEMAFRRAIALNPGYPDAYYNLAQMKTFCRDRDDEISHLESLAIQAESLPPAKRPYIHFALAKALDDVGECARAFEQLLKGNTIKRRDLAYDETRTLQYFRQIAEVFDGKLLAGKGVLGDPSLMPIFVLGMPRTGSTLVEQILTSHPLIHGGGELKLVSEAVNSLSESRSFDYPASFASIDAVTLCYLSEAYLRGLPEVASGQLRVTDKMPANFVYVGLIHLMLPNARIIHTVRDPVDTCMSCFSKLFVSGMPFSYDLGELGRYYRSYVGLMNHWKATLPAGCILEVSYENLVNDLEGEARRLIEYCGLPWNAACTRFDKNDRAVSTASNVQVRQPIFQSSVNRWHRYKDYIKPLLDELGLLA